MKIPDDEMKVCLSVLQRIANARGTVERDERFNALISKVYREGRRYEQQEIDRSRRRDDLAVQSTTGMVSIQRDAVAPAALPAPDQAVSRRIEIPESCYICKAEFNDVHFFYHLLCPKCAEYNYRMRSVTADLTGRTALVTGGRVKIGHQVVLRLLRDGASVIVTTRFPAAAARRLEAEPDSAEWSHRVRVHGLDLRNIPAVERFAQHLLETESAIDILIHNAAQTIRRPHGFYDELVKQEMDPAASLNAGAQRLIAQGAPSTLAISDSSALLPSVMPTVTDILPTDALHDNEELADSRTTNSWRLKLDEVGPQEMLEVQLVNSVAPFLLNSRLKPLLTRSPFARRFIVNVSAMEGQFVRRKTIYHPHTNMAKAALNMMTRTSGDDYARDQIYMTSVDTGWVTDENPGPRRLRKQTDTGFYAPLDIIDGMARIYHPIAAGLNEPQTPFFGVFLKDYAVTAW